MDKLENLFGKRSGNVFPTPDHGTMEAITVRASVGLAMSRKPNVSTPTLGQSLLYVVAGTQYCV